MVLGNGVDTRYVMKYLGSQLNCEKWILPPGHYFALIQLGYDAAGPTYIRAQISNGIQLTRGKLNADDSSTY